MIDTVACCIIGTFTGYFAYSHLTDPERILEDSFGGGGGTISTITTEKEQDGEIGVGEEDHHDISNHHHTNTPLEIHLIAIIGSFWLFLSLVMFYIGLFQPSSNTRKFVLGVFALLQILQIIHQYKFPHSGEDKSPASATEHPIPMLLLLMWVAILGGTLSKTDAKRREIVRAKQKAKSKVALYAKHAASKDKVTIKIDKGD